MTEETSPIQRHWLTRVTDAISDGVLMVDLEGEITYASPAALDLLAADDLDEVRREWRTLAARIREMGMAATAEREATRLAEVDVQGVTRRFEISVHDIDEDMCVGYLAILADHDARERLDLALHIASAARSLEVQLRGVLHDVKAPMNAMLLNLDLLDQVLKAPAREGETAVADVEGYLTTVQREMRRLDRMLTDALTPADPRATDDGRRVDLAEVVEQVVRLIRPQASAERVRLAIDAEPDVHVRSTYRDRLKQAVMNVLLNAVEASPRPGEVRVRVAAGDGVAIVSVEDDGPGVPRYLARRLLHHPHVTSKPKGTGLGLYVARSTMIQHDGDITVGEAQGGGTLVELRMPLDRT